MSELFAPAPEPPTELGRYRILSSTAGVRVSPLQLGAMSIGDAWKDFMGSMDKNASFKLLDAFVEAGGNFIDTANNYQNEQSETWIGEWMAERKNRDLIVLATKFTTPYRNWHILVEQGKVLYLGISDSPAWVVSAANEYAKARGKTQFSIYQGRWNLMVRDFEREIIPMARNYGMALAPWDVLGGGKFQSKKALEERKKKGEGLRSMMGDGGQTEEEAKISEALCNVAAEHGIESPTAVALAYVMSKTPNVFPIVGGRKVEHLKDNIQALKIKLTDKQIEYLESVQSFEPGFPNSFIGVDPHVTGKANFLMAAAAPYAFVKGSKAIGHE